MAPQLLLTIVWWFAYRWRASERWTFFLFLWLLLSPIALYLIASLLFPDLDNEQPIADWRIYFYENHRDIFLLCALILPIDIMDALLKGLAHFRAQGPVYLITLGFVLRTLPRRGADKERALSRIFRNPFFGLQPRFAR